MVPVLSNQFRPETAPFARLHAGIVVRDLSPRYDSRAAGWVAEHCGKLGNVDGSRAGDAPEVSVIVVTYERAPLVEACLDSLLGQTDVAFEIVVVLNGASADVERSVEARAAHDSRLRLVTISKTSASEARNTGVAASSGAVLYFLDDDVEVPPGGIRAVARTLQEHPDVAIAGGPNLTPPDDPGFAQLAGDLLGSAFGTGITLRRYSASPPREATEKDLTLCNLAIRREVFTGGARFPEQWGGEENVLMGRASRSGHRFWYSPDLWVHHRRRDTLRTHLQQMYRYGFGRGIAILSAPATFHPAFFAPVGLLVAIVVLPIVAHLWSPWALLPLGLYAVLAIGASMVVALRRRRALYAVLLPGLFTLTHLAYALGLLRGLRRGFRAADPSESKSALDTN